MVLEDLQRMPAELQHSLAPLLDPDPDTRGEVQPLGCPFPIRAQAPLLFATCTTGEDCQHALPPAMTDSFVQVPNPNQEQR